MRARAERAMYPETKQGLLRIAEDYDVLATRSQQRAAALRARAGGGDQVVATVVEQVPTQPEAQPEPELAVQAGA